MRATLPAPSPDAEATQDEGAALRARMASGDLDALRDYCCLGTTSHFSWTDRSAIGSMLEKYPVPVITRILEGLREPKGPWGRLPEFVAYGQLNNGGLAVFFATQPAEADLDLLLSHREIGFCVATSCTFAPELQLRAIRNSKDPAALLARNYDLGRWYNLAGFWDFVRSILGHSPLDVPQNFFKARQVDHLVRTLLHVPEAVTYLTDSQRSRLPGWQAFAQLKDYQPGTPIPVDADIVRQWLSWTIHGQAAKPRFEEFFGSALSEPASGFVWTPGTIKLSRTPLVLTEYTATLRGSKEPLAWRLHQPGAILHRPPQISAEKEAIQYLAASGARLFSADMFRYGRFDTIVTLPPTSRSAIPEARQVAFFAFAALAKHETRDFPWQAWVDFYTALSPSLQTEIRPCLQQAVTAAGMRHIMAQKAAACQPGSTTATLDDSGWANLARLLMAEGDFILPAEVTAYVT